MEVNIQEHKVKSWLRLIAIKGIGPATAGRLISYFDTPEAIFSATQAELLSAGASEELISRLRQSTPVDVSKELSWLAESENHHIVTLDSPDYPRLLAESSAAPPLLYCKGDISLMHEPQLAIVGTRNPTVAGRQAAQEFSSEIVRQGLCITSGLALGIDGIAHQASLDAGGKTIAVAGTGLDRVYPAAHKRLAHQIFDAGLIISEFPLGTSVKGSNFPKRNRIISGLSLGVLVIEAALQSGSLITAGYALEQGREIFALPGSINNPLAKGCHLLIKQGAHLAETVEDILRPLNWLFTAQCQLNIADASARPDKPSDEAKPLLEGSLKEQLEEPLEDSQLVEILRQIDFAPTSLDLLVERCKKPVAELSAKLLTLELSGWIASVAGGYQRQK